MSGSNGDLKVMRITLLNRLKKEGNGREKCHLSLCGKDIEVGEKYTTTGKPGNIKFYHYPCYGRLFSS